MIKIDRKNTLVSGAVTAYSEEDFIVGKIVDVECEGKTSTAIVVKCVPVLGGQLNLLHLDLDWKSLE